MKQLLAFCAFLTLISSFTIAQTPMHRLYPPEQADPSMLREHLSLGVVPNSNGYYLVNAVNPDLMIGIWDGRISVTAIDDKGNLRWNNDYEFPEIADQFNISGSVASLGGDTLGIMLKLLEASGNIENELVIAIDPAGEVAWSRAFGGHANAIQDPLFDGIPAIETALNQGGIFVTRYANTQTEGAEFTNFNQEGVTRWSTQLELNNEVGEVLSPIPTAIDFCTVDSNYYAATAVLNLNSMTPDVGSTLTVLDTLGQHDNTVYIQASDPAVWFQAFQTTCLVDTAVVAMAGVNQDIYANTLEGAVVVVNRDKSIRWARQIRFPGITVTAINGLVSTSDGLVVFGETIDFGAGTSQLFAIRYDMEGEIIWQNVYPTIFAAFSFGDRAVALEEDFSCYATSNLDINTGLQSNNLLVIDPEGAAICYDSLTTEISTDFNYIVNDLSVNAVDAMSSSEIVVEQMPTDSIYNIPEVTLRDTTYCPMDTIMFELDASIEGGVSWLWSTEEITPSIIATTEDQFTVEVQVENDMFGCFMQCDTATISTFDTAMLVVVLDTGPFCETRMVNYQAVVDGSNSRGPFEFLWDTGETTPTITLPVPSTASVTVTDGCGIEVFGGSSISTDPDMPDDFFVNFDADAFCDLGIFRLQILSADQNDVAGLTEIQWFDVNGNLIDENVSVVEVPDFGTYSFTAVDNCNFDVGAEISFSQDDLPQIGTITVTGDDSQICDLGVILNASGSDSNLDPNTFVWSTGTVGPAIVIDEFDVVYTVTGEFCGMTTSTDFQFEPNLDGQVVWPNIFFPDNTADVVDSIDRFFGPLFECPELVEDYELRVYNRFGQLMFESMTPGNDWDGSRDGNEMPGDTYVYYSRYTINNIQEEVNSTITLAR